MPFVRWMTPADDGPNSPRGFKSIRLMCRAQLGHRSTRARWSQAASLAALTVNSRTIRVTIELNSDPGFRFYLAIACFPLSSFSNFTVTPGVAGKALACSGLVACAEHPDDQEGLRAFVAKRVPRFASK